MSKRKKKHIPNKRYNPVVQADKMDKLAGRIDILDKTIKAISKSNDNHILYLANFTRHDIKNAIQSMDSILTTTALSEFSEEKIGALATYLDVIRGTIDNFAKLVPYSTNGKFKLVVLLVAVEILSRSEMSSNGIQFILTYDRTSEKEVDLPFQIILQMLNNLIINSIKSLESCEKKEIQLNAELTDNDLLIEIRDTGKEIPLENIEKVFDYGFSTTGGSGIGLYHAKYLCDQLNGKIFVSLSSEEIFTKTFSLKLPI